MAVERARRDHLHRRPLAGERGLGVVHDRAARAPVGLTPTLPGATGRPGRCRCGTRSPCPLARRRPRTAPSHRGASRGRSGAAWSAGTPPEALPGRPLELGHRVLDREGRDLGGDDVAIGDGGDLFQGPLVARPHARLEQFRGAEGGRPHAERREDHLAPDALLVQVPQPQPGVPDADAPCGSPPGTSPRPRSAACGGTSDRRPGRSRTRRRGPSPPSASGRRDAWAAATPTGRPARGSASRPSWSRSSPCIRAFHLLIQLSMIF